jgi:hypothetical protein
LDFGAAGHGNVVVDLSMHADTITSRFHDPISGSDEVCTTAFRGATSTDKGISSDPTGIGLDRLI